MYIGPLTGVPTINSSITVSNTIISDCLIPSQIDIILIDNLQSDYEFSVVFDNLTFADIQFELGGNLIKYSHLLPNSFQMINSSFRNITGGRINVESYTADTDVFTTKVLMTNIHADNINSEYGSFIVLKVGADLTIIDSEFTNMNSYEQGSAIFTGTELTTAVIQNTLFENNTAISGGVIYSKQRNTVKFNN